MTYIGFFHYLGFFSLTLPDHTLSSFITQSQRGNTRNWTHMQCTTMHTRIQKDTPQSYMYTWRDTHIQTQPYKFILVYYIYINTNVISVYLYRAIGLLYALIYPQ